MNSGTHEIIVWIKGHTVGDRFLNKSFDLSVEIMNCVEDGRGFKLKCPIGSWKVYAPGAVARVQVTDLKTQAEV